MISFLIPFRTDNAYREASFQFVRNTLVRDWPNDEVIVMDLDGEFNRAAVRNAAAAKASGDVLVFVDADSYSPKEQLQWAIQNVQSTKWVFPYDFYYSLTAPGSMKVMVGDQVDTHDLVYVFPGPDSVDRPSAVGGCVVVTREAFDKVNGYDERFRGWGEEDRAFALSLETLVGPGYRVPGPIYHLWHPAPAEEQFEQPNFEYNRVLCNRYREAKGDQLAMHEIIKYH